ncbi:MAG TPA: M20/M25/M40 family metallo-hydrolase [Candidatus Binatia bacterium]
MANFRTSLRQKRRQIAGLLLPALLLTFFFVLGGRTNEIPTTVPESSTGEELARHVRALASEEMMGRGVDTPGIALARDYIAQEFKSYGLFPGGDNGSYFQRLDVVTGVEVKEPSAAALDKGADLKLTTDWIPLGFSDSGTVEAGLVFAGYGITAKDYVYDDYAGIDVKGRIVLVLRYEPPPKNGNSPFRKLPEASRYATLQAKAANAREHGAAGLILVDFSPKQGQNELLSLRRSLGRSQDDLIAVQVRREVVERRLAAEGLSLAELKDKIDRDEKPASVTIPAVRASLTVKLGKITRPSDNVVAVLPGADPKLKQENIVIGAHYDHIGLGYFGTGSSKTEGQIHHGADDNASGTAVMMSVAARLGRMGERPPRTIVFVAFTGEELGLRGSRYFVDHPPFPTASTRAMINLDMVGRMKDDQVTAASVDSAKEFRALVGRAAEGLKVTMRPGGGSSDHVSFHRKEIPALHFTTGIHPDYHRPSDTWEKLNIQGMAKINDMLFKLAREIAAAKEGFTFVKVPSTRDG